MSEKIHIYCILFYLLIPFMSSLSNDDPENVFFTGRISKINEIASFIRIRGLSKNMKFLSKKDQVDFWGPDYPIRRCRGVVEAKSNLYILLKIPHIKKCISKVGISVGTYLHISGKDYKDNMKKAKEVVQILHKKRIAMEIRVNRYKKELEQYIERVELINQRFGLLKGKLEAEWQEELTNLESDKANTLGNYQVSLNELEEIYHKLEQYKVVDNKTELDRWALDSRLYFKK